MGYKIITDPVEMDLLWEVGLLYSQDKYEKKWRRDPEGTYGTQKPSEFITQNNTHIFGIFTE